MIRRPPRSTRTDTLFPYTTLFRSLDGAIALNGVAVSLNRQAFEWGRRAALDLPAVQAVAQGDRPPHHILSSSLDEEVARRVAFLTDYQDAAYARRYADVVEPTRAAEAAIGRASCRARVCQYVSIAGAPRTI